MANKPNYKKYTKKDFINYAKGFDYYKKVKNFTLNQFRIFYDFTHKDKVNGYEINLLTQIWVEGKKDDR